MTTTKAALVIRVDAQDRLGDIFGPEALESALADFGDRMDHVTSNLLAQHEIIDRCKQVDTGKWMAAFRIVAGGLPRDATETCGAIEAAARKLVHDGLIDVFGGGTGGRVATTVAVLSLPASHSGIFEELPRNWFEQQLGDLPRSPLFETDVPADQFMSALEERSIRTFLQPIVDMRDRSVVGYEALTRGPAGTSLERPDRLFDAAHAFGRSVELELLCAQLALERTNGRTPAGRFLTVNLGPDALALASESLPLAGREEVVFELTEHMPINAAEGLVGAVEGLRDRGVDLALDDTGCGFADLDTTRILRPEVVKLCITVVRNSDKGAPFLPAICETTNALQALGSRVLAEGVETEDQHAALARCGIELAQGWLYARPEPVDLVLA